MKWFIGGLAVLLLLCVTRHHREYRTSRSTSSSSLAACARKGMRAAPSAALGWRHASCRRIASHN